MQLISQRLKLVRMVPTQKITNATVSAKTAGTGSVGSLGIVDTQGWQRCILIVGKGGGTSKLKSFHLGFQSGAATLMASSTLISGYTSGIVLSGKTASAVYGIDLNLVGIGNAKRYLNCKVITSTTSTPFHVYALLYNGEQFPPSTTGYTGGLTRIG